MQNVSNTEAEVKKSVAYKKSVYWTNTQLLEIKLKFLNKKIVESNR